MLEIGTQKVAQVILMARELERGEVELRAFIEGLAVEEQTSLVALMWIGRESFAADELEQALQFAEEEATSPTVDYLLGSPHLSDHLENGLDALGISVTDDESDLVVRA